MMGGGQGIVGLLRVGRWLERVGRKCRKKEAKSGDLGALWRRGDGRLCG